MRRLRRGVKRFREYFLPLTLCGRMAPDLPVSPRREPPIAPFQFHRNAIDAMSSPGAAAHHPEQAHPASGPHAVAGDGLVGIFRAGRHVAAMLADQTGQRDLIRADKRSTEQAARCLAPGTIEVARTRALTGCVRASIWLVLGFVHSSRVPACRVPSPRHGWAGPYYAGM